MTNKNFKLLINVINFVLGRWEFIIGVLFGGSVIHFYNKIIINKKNQGEIEQQGSKNQANQNIESPHSSSRNIHCEGDIYIIKFDNNYKDEQSVKKDYYEQK